MRSTNEQTIYTLEVYDILTYLSDLGGLFDIVFAVGSLLAIVFTAKVFNVALMTQAYRVQQPLPELNPHRRSDLIEAESLTFRDDEKRGAYSRQTYPLRVGRLTEDSITEFEESPKLKH